MGEGLSDTTAQTTAMTGPSRSEWPLPEFIGSYRIVRLLGEGGMGTVYQAEQSNPTRMVALKVIRPGVSSEQLLCRFDHEVEALARLQHPGIAQIYHAGTADSGFGPQPFFVMEFIQGRPLLRFATDRHLNLCARLELVARICDAVNHAHQRGIIHRDLKPANILVDQSGQPKILDFGVARMSDSDVYATRQTDVGQLMGTLAYMSPEQVLGVPQELDVRSDVYALGVMLYELLAAKLPYTVSGMPLHEVARAIREEDPAPLSSIDRAYRGDVETIIAKALEKDKARRYASAADLAADIRRHLVDEPIQARPASTAYQLQKFARRHKTLVAAVVAVVVALAAGIIASTLQAVRARQAEVQARQEAARADSVNEFVREMLASANPLENPNGGRQRTVDQMLAQATRKLDEGALKDEPLTEAGVRFTLGATLNGMGDRVRAEVQLRKALALQKSSLPPAHEDIADTLVALGNVLGANMPETLPYLREALDIRRAVFGDDSREVAQTEYQMIIVGALSLPRAESLPLAQHSVALRRKLFGPDSLEAAESLGALALVYEEERPHRAEAALRDAVAIYRKLAPTDADLGSLHVRLSRTLNTLRRYAEAEAHAREALAVFATIGLGDHLRVLNAKTALMQSLVGQNQLAAAETAANELLAMARRLFPNGAPRLLIAMRQSTQVLSAQQRWDEAAALIQQACDMGKARFSPESQPYAGCLTDVAATRLAQGRAPEAERLYREALPILRRVVGNSSAITAAKEMAFIDTLRKQHKDREAEQLLHERIAVYRLDDAGHQNLRTLLTGLADLENALGRPADAEAHVREALRIGQQVLDAEDSRLVEMKSILGASLAAQGKPPSPR